MLLCNNNNSNAVKTALISSMHLTLIQSHPEYPIQPFIHYCADIPFPKESVTCPRGCHYQHVDDTCRRDREYYYGEYYDQYYHYGESKAEAQRFKAAGGPSKTWSFPYYSKLKKYYYSGTASKNPEETTICQGHFPSILSFLH